MVLEDAVPSERALRLAKARLGYVPPCEPGEVEDGIQEVKAPGWKSLVRFLSDEPPPVYYVWRGHRLASWQLESSYARLLKDLTPEERAGQLKTHRQTFLNALRGRRGPNPPPIRDHDDFMELWALGQHHGLATPLLDWTASPYVATFFAFANGAPTQTEPRAVLGLSEHPLAANLLDQWYALKSKEPLDFGNLRRKYIRVHRPESNENPRLLSQSGLFTRTPSDESVEAFVKANFPGRNEKAVLLKLVIPNEAREEVLRGLARMNITYLSLFPDLYGATQHSNLAAEFPGYEFTGFNL